jgi:hypothetical protein
MQIFLDFDGTVVEHYYPLIGAYNQGCSEVVSMLQALGHEVILNTYRVEIEDESLKEAIDFLNSLPLAKRISKRTSKKVHPSPWNIEDARQVGKLFIDDIAVGIPLIDAPVSGGKMVDWEAIKKQLIGIC